MQNFVIFNWFKFRGLSFTITGLKTLLLKAGDVDAGQETQI
jgi:hypothetical protein